MTLLWHLALTLYLCILPLGALLPMGGPEIGFHFNDKIAHALAFLVLAWLADLAWPGRRFDWVNFLSLLTLGVLIEALQYHTNYRSASFGDLLADVVGLFLYGGIRLRLRRLSNRLLH